jgi:predicted TPR repeat methyltransferase
MLMAELPKLRPTPGARALLERLRADGLHLVAATSASGSELDALLRQADVADLIEAAASASDAEHSKPDPDIVIAALKKAGAAAAAAVMIGDTPYDIEAARAAGVAAVALRCGGGWGDEAFSGASPSMTIRRICCGGSTRLRSRLLRKSIVSGAGTTRFRAAADARRTRTLPRRHRSFARWSQQVEVPPGMACIRPQRRVAARHGLSLRLRLPAVDAREDGDPIDVLVLADESVPPATLVPCRIVGVIEAEQQDQGKGSERNDRLIAVAHKSHRYRSCERSKTSPRTSSTRSRASSSSITSSAAAASPRSLVAAGGRAGPDRGRRSPFRGAPPPESLKQQRGKLAPSGRRVRQLPTAAPDPISRRLAGRLRVTKPRVLIRPDISRRQNDGMDDRFEAAKAAFMSGLAAFEGGRWEAAERDYEASLDLVPGRVSTLVNLGATRLKLGKAQAALDVLAEALEMEPHDLDAWSHKALALSMLERGAEAIACHDHVLAQDRERVANWVLRGTACADLQRHQEALRSYEEALRRQPSHAGTWFLLGQSQQRLGLHAEALGAYDKALACDPALAEAWSHRGGILRDAGRSAEARASFEQALACGADPALNRYFLAAVAGREAPPQAPSAYVGPLFDDYAEDFDAHLVAGLRYRGHEQLAQHLATVGPFGYRSALDLGCGTGLCGALLRGRVERLLGVDLSKGMLAKAAARGVYDELIEAELVEHLETTGGRHDLVFAADVFIYIGDLAPVFRGVRRVLAAGGIFCFSVELSATEGVDFELQPSLRYAHSERYLRELAQACGLSVVGEPSRHAIREDQQRPVAALFIALTPSAAGAPQR